MGQIHRNRKQIHGCLGIGEEIQEVTTHECGVFRVMRMFWNYKSVMVAPSLNIPKSTE